jgi:hypothetical protein
LDVLAAHERNEQVGAALKQLRETQDAISAHPKRLGGQALLPLVDLALKSTAGVPA